MDASLKLILSSPAEAWSLIQSGFMIRAKFWDEFYTKHRFILLVYGVTRLADNGAEVFELAKTTMLGNEDQVYKDLETGNYLIVKPDATDVMRIMVIPNG